MCAIVPPNNPPALIKCYLNLHQCSLSVFPEVELFLSEVRKDILNPKNSRKPKDNLSKEERYAMKNLKIDDRVIRI